MSVSLGGPNGVQVGQTWYRTGKRIRIERISGGKAFYWSSGPNGHFPNGRFVGISIDRMISGKSGWKPCPSQGS